jgi:alkylhydroperoxidase family enzyme
MARIPYPDPADQSEDARDRLRRMGSLNVTRMMSHSEGAMQAYGKLGTFLLRKGRLDPVLREVVILRIGQICGSDYEWHQHVSVARAVGMSEDTLSAIEVQAFDRLGERERVAVRIAEEIARDRGASAETMGAASSHFTKEELVELVLVAGYYIMTAGFLLSFGIEIEDTPPLGASMTPS